MYFRQVSDCAAYTDDGNRRLGKPGNRLKFTFYVGADMFYFRCGKETGRFKFSVKLTAPMGILTECSCFLFLPMIFLYWRRLNQKEEIPMCQSYVSLRKTECSFLLPADNRHGNISSGMNPLQERRTVAGCSYGSRGNCKCLCHLVNFGKM